MCLNSRLYTYLVQGPSIDVSIVTSLMEDRFVVMLAPLCMHIELIDSYYYETLHLINQ